MLHSQAIMLYLWNINLVSFTHLLERYTNICRHFSRGRTSTHSRPCAFTLCTSENRLLQFNVLTQSLKWPLKRNALRTPTTTAGLSLLQVTYIYYIYTVFHATHLYFEKSCLHSFQCTSFFFLWLYYYKKNVFKCALLM